MLTYADMAFPRLPVSEELAHRGDGNPAGSAFLRENVRCLRCWGLLSPAAWASKARKQTPTHLYTNTKHSSPYAGLSGGSRSDRRHQGRGVKGWVIPLSLLEEAGLMDEQSEEMWKRCRVGENIMGFPLDMISSPHVHIMQHSWWWGQRGAVGACVPAVQSALTCTLAQTVKHLNLWSIRKINILAPTCTYLESGSEICVQTFSQTICVRTICVRTFSWTICVRTFSRTICVRTFSRTICVWTFSRTNHDSRIVFV